MGDGDHSDPNPYASPESAELEVAGEQDGVRQQLRRNKHRQILWMLLTFAVYGFVSGLMIDGDESQERLLNLFTGLVFAFFVYRWCEFDRLELGNDRWPMFGVMLIICPGPLIIVPLYLIVSRGVRGIVAVLIAGGLFLAFVMVAGVCGFLGALLSGDVPF